MVNGKPTPCEKELHHNDRVMFGSASLFVLHHPVELENMKKDGVKLEEITYGLSTDGNRGELWVQHGQEQRPVQK
ncbi:hypothetical protein OS493_035814 [Desmophyllum pertusum]|uniref:Uncharacterized protein n=1 Tax=Desmophyllum pertusum TaxID=174260 RepID=A0A9W9Y7H7_9CNID|nr:hypothetical protein OS493_035814 [Desmophyllum pertusum]